MADNHNQASTVICRNTVTDCMADCIAGETHHEDQTIRCSHTALNGLADANGTCSGWSRLATSTAPVLN